MEKENKIIEELMNEKFYDLFLSLDISKIRDLAIQSEPGKRRDFFNKLYELALQSKQAELIEKGVF